MPRGGALACLVAVAFAAGCDCSSGETVLAIDLRTDFLAGTEISSAVTEVAPGSAFEPGAAVLSVSTTLEAGDDLLDPTRIAELDRPPGTYAVRVRVLDPSGARRGERLMIVTLEESTIATAVILRRCETVDCPEGQTCEAGECVDPRCRPEEPETCGEPMCSTDGMCTAPRCFRPACIAGACATVPDDSRCGPPDGGLSDAGPVDCTLDIHCDDANVCTEDVCSMGRCEHVATDVACDDGVFCNGFDRCAGGTCSVHEGDPCPTSCDEELGGCGGCPATPCPEPSMGDWGPCEWEGICDESSVQRRTTRTFECLGGVCMPIDTDETMPCTRETSGVACFAEPGPWGPCVTDAACDGTGTETRTIAYMLCAGDVCGSGVSYVPDTPRDCTIRPTPCGSGQECCSAGCTDVGSDRSNCGACGNDCTALVDTTFGMWRADNCSGGTCMCGGRSVACAPAQICCPVVGIIQCVDPLGDEAHCGGCNRACGMGQTCMMGVCR